MTYELIIQLKNSGFPLRIQENANLDGDSIVYAPTLSELISACGDEFMSLTYILDVKGNYWRANSRKRGDDGWETIDKIASGITTEETVALLWLELQK